MYSAPWNGRWPEDGLRAPYRGRDFGLDTQIYPLEIRTLAPATVAYATMSGHAPPLAYRMPALRPFVIASSRKYVYVQIRLAARAAKPKPPSLL